MLRRDRLDSRVRTKSMIPSAVDLPDEEIKKREKYGTIVSMGQETLKALLILNGAAAIAFLGFMGTALPRIKMGPEVLDPFIGAMWGFILGAFMAVFSYGAIFLTNCFSFVRWDRTSNAMFGVTCAVTLVAFGCFIYGGAMATKGFRGAAATLSAQLPATTDRCP